MTAYVDLPWTDEDDSDGGVTLWDVVDIAVAVALAAIVIWQRSYLMYLSYLLGGLWELYIAVPAIAVASAALTAWWSWRVGSPHPAVYPVLLACVGIMLVGVVAWQVTM